MPTFSDLEPGPTIYWPAGTSARWRLTIRQCKTCPALDLSGDDVEVEFILKRSATASDATAKFTKKLSTGGIVGVDLALGIVDVIVDADDTVAADGVGEWFYTTRVTLDTGEILQPFGLSGTARLDLTVPTDCPVVSADSTTGTIDPVALTPAPLPAYATIAYVTSAVAAEATLRTAGDAATLAAAATDATTKANAAKADAIAAAATDATTKANAAAAASIPLTQKDAPGGVAAYDKTQPLAVASAGPLQAYFAAVAKMRAGTLAQVIGLFIGDSTSAGYNGTMVGAKATSYPTRFAQIMDGLGYGAQESSFFATNTGPDGTAGNSYDPRMTVGAGWSASVDTLGGKFWVNTTTTNAISFTPTQSYDRIVIRFSNFGGVFTVNKDGGSTLYTSTTNGTETIKTVTVNCTAGTGTINIARSSGVCVVLSVDAYLSTAPKISVINAGLSSTKASDVAVATAPWGPMAVLPQIGAHLVVICLGINDVGALSPVLTFTANLQTIVTTAKNAGASVVICSNIPFDKPSVSTLYPGYRAAMQSIALASNCLFIDAYQRYTDYATATSLGLLADTLHPNNAGYVDFAGVIAHELARFTPPALA